MRRPTPIPFLSIDIKEVESVLERVKAVAEPSDYEVCRLLLQSFQALTKACREQGTTIARVLRLFHLSGSEKSADVLKHTPTETADAGVAPPSPAGGDTHDGGDGDSVKSAGAEPLAPPPVAPPKAKPKRRGHGRVPATAYRQAQHIDVPLAHLRPGDPCPRCKRGHLNPLQAPARILRIFGQAPLAAKCWDCERCRCATCGHVFTATAPPEAQGPKFDETAASMIAVCNYGVGIPFHRLEGLQRNLETPLPASTQWQIVSERVELVRPVHVELRRLAAQADVLHSDDSYVRVLELMGVRRERLVDNNVLPLPERTGLFTTGIVAVLTLDQVKRTIGLFDTGRKHAGENLADLLERRDKTLPPPILMGDALSRNLPKGHVVLDSNCIAHGRRKIVDEINNYPKDVRPILEGLALIYKVDKECKQRGLSDVDRLRAHHKQSRPVMERLLLHMTAIVDAKTVETNSGFGNAIHYFLKRWDKFTLFYRKAGAPLDNNICERTLKMAIKRRNGSLFYKTLRGADVGDVYMTLIHTAELQGENPVHYLTALQRNCNAVAEKPGEWLPWNYKNTLARLGGETPEPRRPDAPELRPGPQPASNDVAQEDAAE